MGVWYLIVLLLGIVPRRAFSRVSRVARPALSSARSADVAGYIAAAGLVASFVAEHTVFDRAIEVLRPISFVRDLPAPLPGAHISPTALGAIADMRLGFAVVEVALLAAFIACCTRMRRAAFRTATIGTATLCGSYSLLRHAVESADPYLYIGLATLGMRAFAPPPIAFVGVLAPISRLWGVPLLPSAYGPVWLAAAHVVTFAGSLGTRLFALKCVGLCCVAITVLLARRLNVSRRIVVGLACNPAIFDQYVITAHNDLFGIDFVLAAMVAAEYGNARLSTAFGLLAAFTKISLAPLTLLATAYEPSPRRRIAYMAVVAVTVGIVYWLGFGGAMWTALLTVAQRYRESSTTTASPVQLLHYAGAAFVLVSIVWTVLTRRRAANLAWLAPNLGQFPLSWYLVWGLPFVTGDDAIASVFLASFPLSAFALSTVYPNTLEFDAVRGAIVVGILVIFAYGLRPAARRG